MSAVSRKSSHRYRIGSIARALLAGAVAFAGLLAGPRATAEEKCDLKVGSKAPPFSVSMADGSEGVVLRKGLNKHAPVIVAFWAYHCVPCTHELPMLQKLSYELGDKVSFLLVHDGPDESLMRQKLTELKVKLKSASDDSRAKEDRYCVHELPRTFLIDKEGIIRAIFDKADEPRLREELSRLGVPAKG